MSEEIKSGKEILDNFFKEIATLPDVEKNVINVITGMYKEGKLSEKNISNALLALREQPNND